MRLETGSPLLPGPDLLGGLLHSRERFIAGARVDGQSGDPGPVSPWAFRGTLRHVQTLHVRREARGDGRALLHLNKTRYQPQAPKVVSTHVSPCTRCGLSRALLLPPACFPSPLACFPKFLVPCKR